MWIGGFKNDNSPYLTWITGMSLPEYDKVDSSISTYNYGGDSFAFMQTGEYGKLQMGVSASPYLGDGFIVVNEYDNNFYSPVKVLPDETPYKLKKGDSEHIEGEFSFEAYTYTDADLKATFHYTDDYFLNNSTYYNQSLATMSLCMALAGFDSAHSGDNNIRELCDKIDLQDVKVDNYGETSENSIGSVISHKTIILDKKEYELVSVVVRGGGYGREWSSNFYIGNETKENDGDHTGFSIAADEVADLFAENGIDYGVEDINEKIYPVDSYKTSVDAGSAIKDFDFFNIIHTAPMGSNVKSMVDALATDLFKDRENYVQNYEQSLRAVIAIAMCKEVQESFAESIDGTGGKVEVIIWSYTDDVLEALWDMNYNKLKEKIVYMLKEIVFVVNLDVKRALDEAGIDDYDGDPIEDIAELISGVLCDFASNNVYKAVDIVLNADKLFSPHYPENVLAWMQAGDPNYNEDAIPWNGISELRRLLVNCPVDVEVYDSNSKLVAKITDDNVEPIENGLAAYIDYDGQKVICLPSDGEYYVELTATDRGMMNCTIEEYQSIYDECVKVQNFYDINLVKDARFEMNIPKCTDITSTGSDCEYVIDTEGDTIIPDEVMIGNEISDSSVNVSVYTNDEKGGKVSGSGIRTKGTFANVIAIPNEGYVFKGWYDSKGNVVATDEEYRFRADSDTTLYAQFDNETAKGQTDGEETSSKADKKETVSKVEKTKKTTVAKVKKVKAKRISKKKIRISWAKSKKAKYYIVQYSLAKKFKTNKKYKTKTKKTKKRYTVIKKLNKKKVYYVRVRAVKVVNGIVYKGKWSKTVKVKVKK